jgi:hypothetical protein
MGRGSGDHMTATGDFHLHVYYILAGKMISSRYIRFSSVAAMKRFVIFHRFAVDAALRAYEIFQKFLEKRARIGFLKKKPLTIQLDHQRQRQDLISVIFTIPTAAFSSNQTLLE